MLQPNALPLNLALGVAFALGVLLMWVAMKGAVRLLWSERRMLTGDLAQCEVRRQQDADVIASLEAKIGRDADFMRAQRVFADGLRAERDSLRDDLRAASEELTKTTTAWQEASRAEAGKRSRRGPGMAS